MGVTILKVGWPGPLQPGEKLVLEQRCFRAVTSKTCPSYRIGFNLRPLWGITLKVTDRRVLVLTDLFRCMSQEIGMWYPGRNPSDDPEMLTGVSSTTGLFGPCVEIRSCNPKRRMRLIWSPNLTLRFFLDEPAPIVAAIAEQMGR